MYNLCELLCIITEIYRMDNQNNNLHTKKWRRQSECSEPMMKLWDF